MAHGPQGSAAFEQLGIDLLLAMGYGGGRRDAALRLGRSGDGGVDAVIRLDPLGLDLLYLQAKCYRPDHLVDVAAVRDFSGSLDAKKFSRGVLMTTSRFTRGAEAYVRATPKPIALIDGAELTRLMIEHGVGVRASGTGVKKVENGYFERLCRHYRCNRVLVGMKSFRNEPLRVSPRPRNDERRRTHAYRFWRNHIWKA